MYINIYNYKKSFWGRDVEIFNDETKWGYITWDGNFKSTAVGDLYGKRYLLNIDSYLPLKFKVVDENETTEVASLKFNYWCTRGTLTTHDGEKYQLKSIHHFVSKYVWEKDGAQVMRIDNGFMGGEIESSVSNEEHNALLIVTSLYSTNHVVSTIVIILILLYLIFE